MNDTPPIGKPALPFKAYAGNEPYIFVSFAPEDSALVFPEMLRLHQAGYRVRYDEGTTTGDARTAEVETAILNCALSLVFVTAHVAASRNARHEIQVAVDEEKAFLAVYLEPTDLKSGLRLLLSGQETIRRHELSEAAYHDGLRTSLPEAVQAQSPFDAYLGDEPFVFVSYSHKDSALVFPEIQRLYGQGYRIWYDQGIPIGSNWRGSIGEALAKCAVFLVFITPRAAASEEVYAEIHTGFERWKRNKQSDAYNFVTVYLEPTDLPPHWYVIQPVQGLLPYQTTPSAYRQALQRALDKVRGMRLAAQNESADTKVDTAKEAGNGDVQISPSVSAPDPISPLPASPPTVRQWVKPRRKSSSVATVHNVPATTGRTPSSDNTPVHSVPAAPSTPPQSNPATKINANDGAEMLLIPAGAFLMGDDDQEDNPRHTVFLENYYLYKTPVTVAQYRKFCEGTGRAMPKAPSWGWKEDHTIVNVTWEDAVAYCTWAGVRLPTEAEWEKGARGTDGRKFPWGNEFGGSRLQCSQKSFADAESTASVGSFPKGASPYGALDMAGNVWEWCVDWYDADYTKSALEEKPTDDIAAEDRMSHVVTAQSAPVRNPIGPAQGDCRVVRGGSWFNVNPDYFRASYRLRVAPASRSDFLGFRCASGL